MPYTESQTSAIETRGKTLLVSAGAGSGKTTVLTKRLIERLRAGLDLDEVLVVTFTKAAAADLKEKLYAALVEQYAQEPENRRLSDLMFRLPGAHISTIHSFCLDLIRENFALLGVSPTLRVADTAESAILFQNCFEETLDRFADSENAEFTALADAFAEDRGFEKFFGMTQSVYGRLTAVPFWQNTLRETIKKHEKQLEIAKTDFFATDLGAAVRDNVKEKLAHYVSRAEEMRDFAEMNLEEKKSRLFQTILEQIEAFVTSAEHYSELRQALGTFDGGRFLSKGIEEDAAAYLKKEKNAVCSGIKNIFRSLSANGEEITAEYGELLRLNTLLLHFLLALDENFSATKKARGLVDFSDLEQMTLSLLVDNVGGEMTRSAVCERCRTRFGEIYIDEYQDVNPLQDQIFSLIACPDNRFMVGDMKQSIYRFRNASAEIFLRYLRQFQTLPNDALQAKIFLRENFRSSRTVIDFVNVVFDALYTTENVGSDYASERLIYASPNASAWPVAVQFIQKSSGETQLDGAKPDCNQTETEYTAYRIRQIVTMLRRPDETPYTYGDVAVLVRSVKGSGPEYERAFRKYGIPYVSSADSDFLERPEILLALSLLRVVNDPTDDLSMASVLRSPLFCIKASDLFVLRKSFLCESLFTAVAAAAGYHNRHYHPHSYRIVAREKIAHKRRNISASLPHAENAENRPSDELCEKSDTFYTWLKKEIRYAREQTTANVLWDVYETTQMLSIVAREPAGHEKKCALQQLYQFALTFEQTSFKGIAPFLDHISDIAGKYLASAPSVTATNAVRILSIHASKGLEFPVCFVGGLGREFNQQDLRSSYLLGEDMFLYCNIKEQNGLIEKKPFLKKAAALAEKQRALEEELRILYVAFTRAKDMLLLTACVSDADAQEAKLFSEASSPADWLLASLNPQGGACYTVSVLDAGQEFPVESAETEETQSGGYPVTPEDIRLDYAYPLAPKIAAKVAVSELRKGLLEDNEYTHKRNSDSLAVPSFAGEEKNAAERGTATHMLMQFADFSYAAEHGAEAEAKRLCANGMLDETQRAMVDYDAVDTFFRSPLYTRMKNAARVWREKRFTLLEDSGLLVPGSKEKILIQGVIDCFFEEADGTCVVIDYKTDRVHGVTGEEILRKRHGMQIRYYCRAVSAMTGKKVRQALLYSFALGREVEVPLADETP